MSEGTSSSSDVVYQLRQSEALACMQRTGISVMQLVQSMAMAVVCKKTVYSSNTSDCHQASEYIRQIRQNGPAALL